MKLLFLYTELAGYFMACLSALAKRGVDVHLVHWPVNNEAPFRFRFPENIYRYPRSNYDGKCLLELSHAISPDVLYCSGWVDKEYLQVCKRFRKQIPVIVGFDNKWTGTLKQRIAALLSRFVIHSNFSHCWIPGNPQLEFANRLNFSGTHILKGLYSCDYDYYHALCMKYSDEKRKHYPHRLIYVGRYYEFKGITDLWKAFADLHDESPNDWELWCMGTGNIAPAVHPKIKHFGFIQPGDMEKFVRETGVFVLPGRFEPWGVAVHEFSASGFPLICSDAVGAAAQFLKEGNNGYAFHAGNSSDLKVALRKIMSMPDEKLWEMGERSAIFAGQITPDKWADALMSVLQ